MNKYLHSIFVVLAIFLLSYPALSQEGEEVENSGPPEQSFERILFIEVSGSQRIEPDTIRSYMTIRPGDLYNEEIVDQSLKILFNTGLFADVAIRYEKSGLIVFVVENPIINEFIFIGNERFKKTELLELINNNQDYIFYNKKKLAYFPKKIYVKTEEDKRNIIDWVKENWFIVLIGCIVLYMLLKTLKSNTYYPFPKECDSDVGLQLRPHYNDDEVRLPDKISRGSSAHSSPRFSRD